MKRGGLPSAVDALDPTVERARELRLKLSKAASQAYNRPDRCSPTAVAFMTRIAACFLIAFSFALTSCSSPPETSSPKNPLTMRQPEKNFFERLSDHMTERECNVGRFTCPLWPRPGRRALRMCGSARHRAQRSHNQINSDGARRAGLPCT